MRAMIELEDVCVSFGVHRAMRHVSFEVAPNEIFGIVGESGSGKSTILRVLMGLQTHSSGQVTVEGRALGAGRDKWFRRNVQMVFQDPYGSLHPMHSVNTVLSEPLAIHGFDDVETRVKKALDEVGLGDGFRFRYPHQLSGGQRQRVAIARALIVEPKILILDEPTSALDVSVQAEILNLLTNIWRNRGLTCVFVSHDLSVIGHMCDRVAFMNQGEIVEVADVEQLEQGQLKNAYSQQLLRASHGYERGAVEGPEVLGEIAR